MNAETLATVASAMFGPRWRVELGRHLGVSKVAIHTWIRKDRVPDERVGQIKALLRDRILIMTDLSHRLIGAENSGA